jgi:hypothetical protein
MVFTKPSVALWLRSKTSGVLYGEKPTYAFKYVVVALIITSGSGLSPASVAVLIPCNLAINSVMNGYAAAPGPLRILLQSPVFGKRTSSLYTGLFVSVTNF